MSEISEIIKRLRHAPCSMTQSEISKRTGIPQPRVSRWEAGDVAAGAEDALKLVALAKEMGVGHEADAPPGTETATPAGA